MPSSDEMIATVHRYVEAFENGDAEAVAAIYADDATIEDPIGTPIKNGRSEILEFYKMGMASGAKLVLEGPVRVAKDYAAFAFQVRLSWDGSQQTIDVIDTFRFDDRGQIIEMKAYFGPINMKTE